MADPSEAKETTGYPQQRQQRRLHEGSGIHVRFWFGASVVTDPSRYFAGEPQVEEQLQFFDWLKEQKSQRSRKQ